MGELHCDKLLVVTFAFVVATLLLFVGSVLCVTPTGNALLLDSSIEVSTSMRAAVPFNGAGAVTGPSRNAQTIALASARHSFLLGQGPLSNLATACFGNKITSSCRAANSLDEVRFASAQQYGSNWKNITPSVQPWPRGSATMVYDQADGYVLLFGGNNQAFYNDTWTFKAGKWQNITSGVAPPARTLAGMAYDAKDSEVVLFGGSNGASYLSDTWIFKAGRWTQLNVSSHPAARGSPMMTYDAKDGYVLLFGGYSSGNTYGDSWKFSGGVWSLLNSTKNPGARWSGTISYDSTDGYVLLFGGRDTSGLMSDTWAFSSGNWTEVFPVTSPPARAYSSMAFDSNDGTVTLFGGCSPCGSTPQSLGDTWVYSRGNWTSVTPAVSPLPRSGSAFTYDVADRYLVLFSGGEPGQVYKDTWINYGLINVASILANPKIIDVGQGVVFNTSVSGGVPPYTFRWSESSASLGCSFSNATSIQCLPRVSSGTFTVTVNVSDSQGVYVLRTSPSIIVNPPLAAGQGTPKYPVIDSGQYILLNANASGGTPPYFFTWYEGSSSSCSSDPIVTGVNGPILNATPVRGTYFCYSVRDNSTGIPADVNTSSTDFVSVDSPLTANPISPNAPNILPGNSLTLTAGPSGGSSPYFIQWYQGQSASCTLNSPIFGATSLSITVAPSSSTEYCYSVGDTSQGLPANHMTSNVDLVTVSSSPPLPVITSFTIIPSPVSVNTKVNVSLVVSGGLYPLSFSYTGLPPGCASVNSSSFTCTPTLAGTYNVTATVKDAQGRSVSSTVTEVVKGAASTVAVSLTTSASVVLVGGSFALTAHPTGGVTPYYFLWSVNGTNVTTGPDAPMWAIHANAAGNYTYEVWVEDSQGNISHSNTVLVQVESTSSPPTGAHHNQSSVLPGPVIFGIPILIPIIIIAVVVGAALFLLTRRRKDTTPPPPAPVATGKSWAEESSSSGIAGPAIPPPPRVEPPDSSFPVKKSGK